MVVNRGFGLRALDDDRGLGAGVDWPKVVVWLLMAAVGLAVWGTAAWVVFDALTHR